VLFCVLKRIFCVYALQSLHCIWVGSCFCVPEHKQTLLLSPGDAGTGECATEQLLTLLLLLPLLLLLQARS
jgi:hypothetical protein